METPRRSVARRLLTIALGTFALGALLVAVAATAFWFAMKAERRTTTAIVPELVGLPIEDAARVAAADGLEIDVADRRNDPAVASGHIAEQDPRPGAQVRQGRRIRVIESLGGRIVRVPSISGRPSREVGIRLEQWPIAGPAKASAASRRPPASSITWRTTWSRCKPSCRTKRTSPALITAFTSTTPSGG